MVVHETDPYNAEPPRQALISDLTPVDAFYVRNHGPVPTIDTESWRLAVDGLVDRPLSLSIDDLRGQFRSREVVATLQCAGNRRAGLIEVREIPGEDPWRSGATSTATWSGVALGEVLEAAGIQPPATDVAFEAPDVAQVADSPQRYGGSVGRSKAEAPEVLLAWGMNGEPLPAVHGGPLRIVVPGYIGARSVKWLHRITAQDHPSTNYFQARSYRVFPADFDPAVAESGEGISLGAIAVNADIADPDDGAAVPAGSTPVRGYALAGDDRRIARVEVSTDGGRSWTQAVLEHELSPWAWRHWHATIAVPAGPTEVVARAWDSAACVQPREPAEVWNPKGYVNNSWARVNINAS